MVFAAQFYPFRPMLRLQTALYFTPRSIFQFAKPSHHYRTKLSFQQPSRFYPKHLLKIIELLLVLYNCMLIFLACQLGALVNHTSRLEWDILVINLTNLKRNSNQYCINIIVSSTFFQANQSANTRFHRICFTGIWLHTSAQEHAARSCGPGQVLD